VLQIWVSSLVFGLVQGAESVGEQHGVWFGTEEVSSVVFGLVQGAESLGEQRGVSLVQGAESGVWYGSGC
jgi:hypothetical protein